MPKSKHAATGISPTEEAAVLEIYTRALTEMVDAILGAMAAGKKPSMENEPKLSFSANQMPSISDGYWNSSDTPDYPSVLDPPYNDQAARAKGRYPIEDFPALAALFETIGSMPRTQATFPGPVDTMLTVYVTLQLEGVIKAHMTRFGNVGVTSESARVVLTPLARGLLAEELDIAIVAPIALTRFDFDRVRIAPNTLILKMSPALQLKRWSSKAFGANGHDSVLAAATHAFVQTGWTIKSAGYLHFSPTMSASWENSRLEVDKLFAALRLATGVETGYAQEIRLGRGWRGYYRPDQPNVFAAPTRRYPEGFDNFAWTRDDLPLVTRADALKTGAILQSMNRVSDRSLTLAFRRLNAAMTRHDPVDGMLDAVIALEILLGDKDSQAIAWKLRMRAAALIAIDADGAAVRAINAAVTKLYKERSAVVHGLVRTKGQGVTPVELRDLAVDVLRKILQVLLEHPVYLDPLQIDSDLMLGLSPEAASGETEA